MIPVTRLEMVLGGEYTLSDYSVRAVNRVARFVSSYCLEPCHVIVSESCVHRLPRALRCVVTERKTHTTGLAETWPGALIHYPVTDGALTLSGGALVLVTFSHSLAHSPPLPSHLLTHSLPHPPTFLPSHSLT